MRDATRKLRSSLALLYGLALITTPALSSAAPIDSTDSLNTNSQLELLSPEHMSEQPLDLPIRLDLYRSARAEAPAQYRGALFSFPELAPEVLLVRIPLHATLDFYLSADLSSELPRLDSVDGETYFSAGFEFKVTSWASVFVEDFQPASGVTGGGENLEINPAPNYSWDGHQLSVGVQVQPTEQLTLRGEVINYLLSNSRRSNGLGGMVSLVHSF